jgi:hypothetical protein
LSYKDCGQANPLAKSIDEQFPWMVKIVPNGPSEPKNCFGVVISNDTVVTCKKIDKIIFLFSDSNLYFQLPIAFTVMGCKRHGKYFSLNT